MTNDYIHGDVFGTWDQIKNYSIAEVYRGFETLNFKDTFFALNVQELKPKRIHTNRYKKIIISYHTEYLNHEALWNFFNANSDCEFLLLCDSNSADIWPSNVTYGKWITWGYQLDVAIKHYGIANSVTYSKHKLSSLSHRHEFHKAAVTSFLLKKFNKEDMIISWNNWCPIVPYYLSDDYYIPDEIKKYLDDNFKSIEPIIIDKFTNLPVLNGNWHHTAYLDCAINLTNESVYNSRAKINNNSVELPAPYLTEKTWKPLIAGRPFIPVGQANTLDALSKLGLEFNYGIDLSFDSDIADFDRMIKIYNCLDTINSMSSHEIYQATLNSTMHNLDHIGSGKFKKQCNTENNQTLEVINQW